MTVTRSSLEDVVARFADIAIRWQDYAIENDIDPTELLLELAPSPELDRAVVGFLRDERWELRRAALELLGRRTIPGAVDVLIDIATAGEDWTFLAIDALARIDEAAVIPALSQALERWKSDRYSAERAARSLASRGDAAVPALVRAAHEGFAPALTACGQIGGSACVAELLHGLDADVPDVIAAAANGIARLRVASALERLHAHLDGLDPGSRAAGPLLEATGALGSPSSYGRLARRIVDRSAPILHSPAATALAALGDPRAIPLLESARSAMHEEERYVIDVALQRLRAMPVP